VSIDSPVGADPTALLRSREYVRLLVLAALLGLPISAAAYGFLTLVHLLQQWVFDDLPRGLGFGTAPAWWPLPVLTLAGVLVGLTIRYLPGRGGHVPAYGLHTSPPAVPELPGVFAAALIGLGLGVVLGPEAPLIALGGGLAVLALGRGAAKRPPQAVALVASVGSFAAIATLLGSPIVGAFLLMEAIGIGGPALGVVLIPGLLAAGMGALTFLGLGSWTGLGTLSLSIPDLTPVASPHVAQFGWAIVIGALGAVIGVVIRRIALRLDPVARANVMLVTPIAGVVTGALAIIFAQTTGHSTSDVLTSGQNALGPLLTGSSSYSVGALLLLILCKGIGYTMALGAFRGGPIFPSMYLGAALGIALSHLPGLPVVAGAAMGITAVCVTMLRLPLTSVLLTALFLGTDGIRLMPLVIVAGVVAYVLSARLTPSPAPADTPST
jgi:H+/Cl- antiporter ClcA